MGRNLNRFVGAAVIMTTSAILMVWLLSGPPAWQSVTVVTPTPGDALLITEEPPPIIDITRQPQSPDETPGADKTETQQMVEDLKFVLGPPSEDNTADPSPATPLSKEPETPPQIEQSAQEEQQQDRWTVQIAAFRDAARAETLLRNLRPFTDSERDLDIYTRPKLRERDNTTFHIIYIGDFDNYEKARRFIVPITNKHRDLRPRIFEQPENTP